MILLLLVILVTKPLRRGSSESSRIAVPETLDGVPILPDEVQALARGVLRLRRISQVAEHSFV